MLRRAVAAATVLAAGFAPVAHADGGGTGIGAPGCEGATLYVQVCAQDGGSAPGTGGTHGGKGSAGASQAGESNAPKCTYTRMSPQRPKDSLMYRNPQPGKTGAVYEIRCESGLTVWDWIADSAAPGGPAIDPEVVAQRAVDSMKLVGPKVASPRPAGTYVVGMPMWMWVDQTPTTYGPNTATATAGGVTVTATAKVSTITWDMGDDTDPVVCHGPGTRYEPSLGKATSPDCGHVYKTVSGAVDGRFHGKATATWTVDWQVAGAPPMPDSSPRYAKAPSPSTSTRHRYCIEGRTPSQERPRIGGEDETEPYCRPARRNLPPRRGGHPPGLVDLGLVRNTPRRRGGRAGQARAAAFSTKGPARQNHPRVPPGRLPVVDWSCVFQPDGCATL